MAGKKVIISESMMRRLVVEEIMSKTDIASLVNTPEFKDMVTGADSVKTLFRGLWERNNFWTGLINGQ